VRERDKYVINGQKVWTSRLQHSDLMIVLARTTPLAEVKRKADGMSVFLIDLRLAQRDVRGGITVRPIPNMVNHETNEVFFDDLEVPADNLIGEEGKGFRYILDGLNAERTLIAAECIGDGWWFVDKARTYASDRIVFDRPIGKNQGVQFPIAESYIELEAANLMRFRACALFDAKKPCGAEANMAKLLAAKGRRGRRPTLACRRTAASGSPASSTSSANFAKRASTRSRRSRPTSSCRSWESTSSGCRGSSEGDPPLQTLPVDLVDGLALTFERVSLHRVTHRP
jgi:hypothetical protein